MSTLTIVSQMIAIIFLGAYIITIGLECTMDLRNNWKTLKLLRMLRECFLFLTIWAIFFTLIHIITLGA